MAQLRLNLVKELPIIRLNDDVRGLVRAYRNQLGLAGRAQADLLHIAFAVSYDIDYLVTWNCAHIANGIVIRRLMKINNQLGRPTPLIFTPEELMVSDERGTS